MMTNRYLTIALTAAATLFVLWFAYDTGYNKAKAEGDLALEQLKLAQAQAVIDSQNKVKSEYEVQIQNLNAALASARNDSAHRLQQLEQFRHADRDLEACRRDLNDVSAVAVGLESIALRADSYLGALVKH